MACPFFHPTERFEDGTWLQPPRLPLGDPCRGRCTVLVDDPIEPGLDEVRKFCNLGYARGRCPRFPAAFDGPDAIRFSIANENSDTLSLVCILERDYSPGRHSAMVYDMRSACFTTRSESSNLDAQARQFVESYLSRRSRSGRA